MYNVHMYVNVKFKREQAEIKVYQVYKEHLESPSTYAVTKSPSNTIEKEQW